MGQHIWRDRVERIADEFIDLAAAPDVRGVEAIRGTLDLTDQMLAAIGHLNATLAMHLRLDAAQGLIVSEVADSPEHDAAAAARVDAAAAVLARRARIIQEAGRALPAAEFDFDRIDLFRVGPDDEPEDPHYRVTMSNPNQVSTLEESRWSSLAAAMVQARRLAADTPIGQTVEVYAFEDGELLPEPIVVHAGASDHNLA